MMKRLTLLITLLSSSFSSMATQSSDASALEIADQSAKYVSINIEVKELGEAGKVLQEATTKLSSSLSQISNNLEDLSPEQLVLINQLAEKIKGISDSLNTTVNDIPNAIDRAKQPSEAIVKSALDQVRLETIDPVVSKLETWLIITIVGLVVLGLALLALFAYCAKHLANMGSTIKEIANGYRVIPLEQYQKGFENPNSD